MFTSNSTKVTSRWESYVPSGNMKCPFVVLYTWVYSHDHCQIYSCEGWPYSTSRCIVIWLATQSGGFLMIWSALWSAWMTWQYLLVNRWWLLNHYCTRANCLSTSYVLYNGLIGAYDVQAVCEDLFDMNILSGHIYSIGKGFAVDLWL